ncbi:MAG TPA: hypothetical protein VKV26_25275 [Dehalococcoidia bacterium]|nr:hypothetical protein [Dehalococcoidia bacterium]
MPARRRPLVRLALAVAFGGLLTALAAAPARAQLPPPTSALSAFATDAIDGQGVVVSWSVGAIALHSDAFIVFRRNALLSGDSGAAIYPAANTVRGYTDYGLANAGLYCYRVAATLGGQYTYASAESCVTFSPGVAGTARPIIGAGCNRFYVALQPGTAMAAIAARFDPSSAVVSLWRFVPDTGAFAAGFFANPTTPTDFTTLPASPEFEVACLNRPATYH